MGGWLGVRGWVCGSVSGKLIWDLVVCGFVLWSCSGRREHGATDGLYMYCIYSIFDTLMALASRGEGGFRQLFRLYIRSSKFNQR